MLGKNIAHMLPFVVLVPSPPAAREPVTVTGESVHPTYEEQVDFTDLDLRQPRGRQTLFRRVMRASTDVCIRYEGRINMNMVMGGPQNTCPNRTYRAARPQIMAAIGRATSNRRQMASAVVVAAPPRER